jgi:hypothetical protein
MSLPETILHGKVGKIPIWMLTAGTVLAILIVVYIRRKRAAQTAAATVNPNAPSDPSTITDTGNSFYGLPQGAVGDYLNQDATNPAYPVGMTAHGIPSPVTNQQWSRLAFDAIVATGADPTLTGNALAKFINGQPVSAAETAIVNIAETMFGAPPEGVIVTVPTTTPPDTSGTPVPQPAPAHPGPQYQNVFKGAIVDDWVNSTGVDWGTIVRLNPDILSNVTKSSDPRKRVFRYNTAYRLY